MLLLRRNVGEKIYIDVGTERIVLTLVDVGGTSARVGVEASRNVAIYRQEIAPEVKTPGQKNEKRK